MLGVRELGAGMTWALGVDVSTKLLAFGAVSSEGDCKWWSLPVGGADTAQRLTSAHRVIMGAAFAVPHPTVVVVEDPKVTAHCFALIAMAGVAMAALHARLGAPTMEIQVTKWKKEIVGHGHASKDQVFVHAVSLGYTGNLQDEADAVCIAAAGLRRL